MGLKDIKIRKNFYGSMVIHLGVIIMGIGVVFPHFIKDKLKLL